MFEPFVSDMPLTYAYNHPNFYRNKAREDAFGEPVYFFPPTYSLDQLGCGGAYYVYGKPCKQGQGRYGNCTWYVGSRYYEVSGILLTEVIGSAWKTFDKYQGRKSGGGLDNKYIGDTIQQGDCIVFVDNKNKSGDGHIAFVEKVDGNVLFISESGYSNNTIYKDKTCITYLLDKSKIISGSKITLRPQKPYTEIVYGVIHTGDNIKKETDYKTLFEQDEALLEQINDLIKNRR